MSVRREARLPSYIRSTAIWIPATIIGLLMVPLAATRRSFGPDWTLHLWAVRQQQWNIEATGHPGLFLSAKPLGAFYPIFAFVGSGIYSVGGYLAIVLGDRPIVAYKLLYLAGLALGYGGFTWLSVQFSLRGWRSQVPGAVLVTGAYFLTDMANRGDLGEFMAVASIPFLLAAICAVVKAPATRLRHRLATVVAVFVLTGSHTITLLWGSMFVVLLGVLALLAWGPTWHRPLPWRRLGELSALGAIGAGLNAWYLFPDLAYGLDTAVAKQSQRGMPGTTHVHLGLLLDPLRPTDRVTGFFSAFSGILRLSLPVLFFAWAIALSVVLWREGDRVAKRLFVALVIVAVAFVRLVVARDSWRFLPHVLYSIQFTYRLDSYVLLTTALLVTIALRWQATARDRVRRPTTIVLLTILVFNVGAATWQVWGAQSRHVTRYGTPDTKGDRLVNEVVKSRYTTPPSWYSQGDFRDVSAPVVAFDPTRTMTVPLNEIHGSKFAGRLDVPDGPAPFLTNIAGGPRFVRMTGIHAVGRTRLGALVVAARDRSAPPVGPVAVTIEETDSAVLRSGAIVSIVSALALLALVAWPARRFLPRRRRADRSVQ